MIEDSQDDSFGLLSTIWSHNYLDKIKNTLPDPLEDDLFNKEVSSIYRSDAVIFEPEIDIDVFAAPRLLLSKNLHNFVNLVPHMSCKTILMDQQSKNNTFMNLNKF